MNGRTQRFLKAKRIMLLAGACALGFSFAAAPYSQALASHSRQDSSGWNGSRDGTSDRRVRSRESNEEREYPKSRSGERRVGNGDEQTRSGERRVGNGDEQTRSRDRSYNDRDRSKTYNDRSVVKRDDRRNQRDYKKRDYKKYDNYDKYVQKNYGNDDHWKHGHKKYEKRRYYRDVVIYRPYGHGYSGYGYYRNDNDAYKWLAFTAITLKLLDNLNESQQRTHERAQINAATGPIGETIYWREAGAYGSVTPVRDGTNNLGRYCREFQQTVTIAGRNEQAYGTACQQPDGSWEVVSTGS